MKIFLGYLQENMVFGKIFLQPGRDFYDYIDERYLLLGGETNGR